VALFQSKKRRWVLALADTHAGHVLGLLNPETVLIRALDDGSVEEWTPELTATQRYLWGLFTEQLAEVREVVGRDEVICFHGGDITQGDRWGDGLIDGVTREDQRIIACANMQPVLDLPTLRHLRLVTGTLVHVPDCAEARIARRLAEISGKDVQSYHHTRASVGGVILEVAHHGPFPGSRDWLKGNVALYHLRDRVYRDHRLGILCADAYIYGHYHEWVWTTLHECWHGKDRDHHLVIVPSFCGLTHFARKSTHSLPALTNGMALFEINEGRLVSIRCLKATLDLRTEETL